MYEQRRLFEESVTRIADGISSYLDLEEQTAQDDVPALLREAEDGRRGPSDLRRRLLLEDGKFDPLYLKSLRLWQLMRHVRRRAEGQPAHATSSRSRSRVTHLVLVQHAPLSIRFRFDEKRFDVDGAYDIRYEIVKKRIDKAVIITGTDERITQPGRSRSSTRTPPRATSIAPTSSICSHSGTSPSAVEDVELDELQGVHGLRALRVTVDLGNPRIDRRITPGDLQSAAPDASRN